MDDISSGILLLLMSIHEDERNKKDNNSFRRHLTLSGKRRRDTRIPHVSLQPPNKSAFQIIYESKNDQSMISVTGFDHASFSFIHNLFKMSMIITLHIHLLEIFNDFQKVKEELVGLGH